MAACQDDEMAGVPVIQGEDIELNFEASVPDAVEIVTRGVDKDGWGIQSLWLFCFDKEGTYISRTLATLADNDVTNPVRTFKATVSSRTRIVHLLANQNLDGFNDNSYPGVYEGSVMTGFSSTSSKIVYWGRVDCSASADAAAFAARFSSTRIPMFRDQAELTYDTDLPAGLTVEGFAVCNYYASGTSVPFNSNTLKFDWPELWQYNPYITTPVTKLKSSDPTDTDTELSKHIYETENQGEDEAYLIFKLSQNGGTPGYYKVSLVDEDKNPLPVYRNYRYTVKFTAAPGSGGSDTFEAAKSAAPLNNTYISVDASIPSIGNEKDGMLTILGKTTVIYDTDGIKKLQYTYTGTKTPVVSWISNDGVTAGEVLTHTWEPVSQTGTIEFPARLMGEDEVCRGVLQIKAGPLVRFIRIITVKKFTFTPIWCSTGIYNGSGATTFISQDVGFTFTVPDSYPAELFPLRCLISTADLSGNGMVKLNVVYPELNGSPNPDYGEDNGLGFKYVYEADKPGMHIIYFRTNYATSLDTSPYGEITLEAEHFESVTKRYTYTDMDRQKLKIANGFEYDISASGSTQEDTKVYYMLVPQRTGSEVEFDLRYGPDNENLPAGVNIAVYTNNLKPVDENRFEQAESSQGSGTFWYYTTISGQDNIRFKTTKPYNGSEAVRFASATQTGGGDYKSVILIVDNFREWTFNAAFSPAVWPYGIGEELALSFDISSFMSANENYPDPVEPGEDFWVYIQTRNLIPNAALNGNKRLEPTSGGYRYWVKTSDLDDSDRVTLHFTTTRIVSAETVTLTTDPAVINFAPEKLSIANAPLEGNLYIGGTGTPVPVNAFVTIERRDGTRIGTFSVGAGGSFTLSLRSEFAYGWDDVLFVKYKDAENVSYQKEVSLSGIKRERQIILGRQ